MGAANAAPARGPLPALKVAVAPDALAVPKVVAPKALALKGVVRKVVARKVDLELLKDVVLKDGQAVPMAGPVAPMVDQADLMGVPVIAMKASSRRPAARSARRWIPRVPRSRRSGRLPPAVRFRPSRCGWSRPVRSWRRRERPRSEDEARESAKPEAKKEKPEPKKEASEKAGGDKKPEPKKEKSEKSESDKKPEA